MQSIRHQSDTSLLHPVSKALRSGHLDYKQLKAPTSDVHSGEIKLLLKRFFVTCCSTHHCKPLLPTKLLPASTTHHWQTAKTPQQGLTQPWQWWDTDSSHPEQPSQLQGKHHQEVRGKKIYLVIANKPHLSLLAHKQGNLALLLH